MTPIWLIAKSVLIEAVRRKEVYVIVLAATILIGAVMTVDFFQLEGIVKFYLDVALKVMSTAAGLTVIVLAARQLPREFEKRTIYPMMAKPVSRLSFLTGKLLGVMLAALFTFGLLMAVYIAGSLYLGGPVPAIHLAQYIYCQMLSLLLLACLSFLLSLAFNLDAAITIGIVIYLASSIVTNILSMPEIYYNTTTFGQVVIVAANYLIPQLELLNLAELTIHSDQWDPLNASLILQLTVYALVYSVIFFGGAFIAFRRRAI